MLSTHLVDAARVMPCIPSFPRRRSGPTVPRRPYVILLSLALLMIGPISPVRVSHAATPPTFTVFTSKAAFEAALDAASPGTRSNVNWDGIPFNGETRTKTLNPNFFAGRGILLDTAPASSVLLVSNVNFRDLNAHYQANFPTFSPTINFKNADDGPQKNIFVLADRLTPALTSAFGAIFTDVEKAGTSGLVFRDQFDKEIGRFYVPAGANGQNQFLGVIFSRPVVARVDVLMGEQGDDFGDVEDVSNGGTADVVVTDDFVLQRGVVALPTISGVSLRSNGVLGVTGIGFADGARIVINGTSHATSNNPLTPDRKLGSAEAAAFIGPGQPVDVQVVNPDGTLSRAVKFSI
jgi:hypothetical protein